MVKLSLTWITSIMVKIAKHFMLNWEIRLLKSLKNKLIAHS